MRDALKETCRTLFVVVLLSAAALHAQTAPPSSAAGVFPLDQVHRGLKGVAYTVFEGTQPEPMDVEILGVLSNALGPGKDMILARLHGTKPEYTGVVAGMSGSPVYVDGKLLGSVSYRIGQFSKEPICGITPIAQMLEVRDLTARPTNQAGAAGELKFAGAQSDAGTVDIHPIETPLVLSGFSPQAIKLWQEKITDSGLTAVAGVGGSASNEKQPEPILPGSAVSAVLVRGDLEIAATCTVTYVDANQLLACGHPITQYGTVSFPMTKATVLATLPSPLNAFKIINTTETVGSFNEDRQSAIRGVFGQSAHMIPVAVTLREGGRPRKLHFEVIDQQQITPIAVLVSFYQALLGDNNEGADNSYHVKGSIQIDGSAAVRIDSWIAPTETLPPSLIAALQLGDRFTRLYSNATQQAKIHSVDIGVESFPERRQFQLEAAHVSSLNVHAGETIIVDASLRPYRGAAKNIRIPVKLPATLSPGPVRLLVSDGPTLDRLSQPPRMATRPLDVNATVAQINSLHDNNSLYVTLLRPEAQAAMEGRSLPSLPVSMANILEPLRNSQEITLNGESATPVTSVSADAVLNGQQVLTLHVE